MTLMHKMLISANRWHSLRSYTALVRDRIRACKGDHELAMINVVGCASREEWVRSGDGHVAVLRHHGLADGMAIYDLGCGAGRTATALRRAGWTGRYKGADIVRPLVDHLKTQCPDYEAIVHRRSTIAAPDASLDMIFHWSVFTHLYPEECYLYMQDAFRALRPGGRMVFSFLEMEDERHRPIFHRRIEHFRRRGWAHALDAFLHRAWIAGWAAELGFTEVRFTSGDDDSAHPAFWQALATMRRPA